MSTFTIAITGTNYSPYIKLSSFDILDGGYLLDPLASPLSFYYSLTTNCGTLTGSNSVSTLTAIGGNFEVIYNDLKNYRFETKGNLVFCDALVNFNLSLFDQSRSLIRNVIFDPDNGEKIKIYAIKIDNSLIYPNLTSINSVYYPSDKFYKIYNPKFIVNYNDGTSQTIVSPLTVAQCGILDSYKNKSILDSLPYFKDANNVAVFINDEKNNDLLASLIDVKSPFVSDTTELDNVELPFSVAPVPRRTVSLFTLPTIIRPEVPPQPEPPKPPVDDNPVEPPKPAYKFQEGNGIILVPNPVDLNENESFINIDSDIILSVGGAPYTQGDGITITT